MHDHNDVAVIKRFLGVPNLRRSTPSMFMGFLPGISLVILRRQFVAEVRWLFPVSRQKRENQENSEILNHGGES